ncbi:hypothetical protein OFR22_08610 [Brachyspira hyodysenteriae]|uniref:hypothetical protein n=1 Tax=Brachyspira hyodysenteriae TaxID=159 RepID=UPI001182C8BB|nr:hypothetical protein [Brachyspira hyodysenteriae]MCZ9839387.1 hypothetical protein [Brachyspira hyodysenteriae]MCZ9847036.1 hypothetical protein [Brachyspira hyodysenteriae]MCZ9850790.1 hypothetical protein [Brachyspira hyodysenteriae]MCZ9860457.1 hypothetical protein [Brachyspira hyodysenteriae]MCZ9870042.1 hypothetical protein [Brachyspira hyodysenteriae]
MFNVLLFTFIAMMIGMILSKILSFIKIRIVVAALFSLIAFAFVVTESESLFHTILALIMILSVIPKIIQDIVVLKIRNIKYVKYMSFLYYSSVYMMSLLYVYYSYYPNYINHSITLRIIAFIFIVGSAYWSFDLIIFMRKLSKVIKSLTYSNFEGLCEKLEIDYEDDRHKSDEEIKEDDEMAGKRAMLRLTLERLAQKNEIKILYLSNTDVYFNPLFFNNCRELAENISKSDIRVDKVLALTNMKSTLALPDNLLIDFFVVENDSIELHEFDDGDFFVHNINNDKIVTCASCGKAKLSSMMEEIEGEWFCSDMCEETEDLCYKISYEKDFVEKPVGEAISDYGSVGVAGVASGQQYLYNFEPLSNKKTGHGFMAERLNTLADRADGKKAYVIGGDKVSGGPDRLINDNTYVQTKYCRTYRDSINAFFDKNGNYIYTNGDNSIIQIMEVPKDQGEAGRNYLFDKLLSGEYKINGKDMSGKPEEVNKFLNEYYKPGKYTLEQTKNIMKFGNIDSLRYDAEIGAVVALYSGGISFAINIAIIYWRTKDIKLAIKSSAIISAKNAGMAFGTFIIASQLQKIDQVNKFITQSININFNNNSIGNSIGYLADSRSHIQNLEKPGASLQISNNNKANSGIRGAAVTAAVTIAITSSIEIIKMARGRISSMQCIKNIVVSASGITGGTIGGLIGGALLAPIPIVGPLVGSFVGGAVGGMVASKVAKTVMDEFIVDDSIRMMEIVTRHLEYLAKNFLLSDEEMKLLTNEVDMLITQNGKFLEEVFAAASRRAFVNSKLKPIVVRITKNTRTKVPSGALEESNIIDVIAEEVPA